MKTTKLYLIPLLIFLTTFLYSCESVTNSAPEDDGILTQEMTLDSNAKKAKVDVCHYDEELDAYGLINIASPAVNAHIEHGDALPGDPVPTMEGFVFDEMCTPELVTPSCILALFESTITDDTVTIQLFGLNADASITEVSFTVLDNLIIVESNGEISGNNVSFGDAGVDLATITLQQIDPNITSARYVLEVTSDCIDGPGIDKTIEFP